MKVEMRGKRREVGYELIHDWELLKGGKERGQVCAMCVMNLSTGKSIICRNNSWNRFCIPCYQVLDLIISAHRS